MHSYDKPFNICTATYRSAYCETEDEVREVIRTSGFRFVDKGGADSEYIDNGEMGISGTMITRRHDEDVDVFHLFRDDKDFAGFVPVNHDDLRAVLDLLKERAAERALEAHLKETGQVHA